MGALMRLRVWWAHRGEGAEQRRWRRARRHLREAGRLLAQSHRDVLRAQTGHVATASFVPGRGYRVAMGPPVSLSTRTNDYPQARSEGLSRADAHGLLIQLAAASYRADVEAELTEGDA